MRLTFIKIAFLGIALSGCKATYKDVSMEEGFSHFIGKEYILKSDMDFSGVNAPPGYNDEINYYVISSRDPGWSGQEVITRETLTKGSIFTIRKVMECTNCLEFSPSRHAIVSLNEKPYKLPIKLYFNEIESSKHVELLQQTHNNSINFAPSAPDS